MYLDTTDPLIRDIVMQATGLPADLIRLITPAQQPASSDDE